MKQITENVHELYWKQNVNCARTMLICLGDLFDMSIDKQTLEAAIGMHGAGGFRAQCGLVEGGLMFIGIYYSHLGIPEEEIIYACYAYAEAFQKKFGSLGCYDLRPDGFSADDPPHLCEELTCEALLFAYTHIKNQLHKAYSL